MRIHLLGPVEVVDGRCVALGGPTQRRLLAVLAIRRNEVVSVARLIDAVWAGGEPPDRADHNVRTYVHRLRASLAENGDRIETVGTGYRLRLGDGELDIAEFDRLTGTATRLAETGELTSAIERLDAAEQLWRGEPAEEFAHEQWAMPVAARLTALRLELRTLRASVLLELGRAPEAVLGLESLVREEPMSERPRALLMRALYESGRQVEASRVFREYRRWLIDEVGVPPSDDLIDLDRAIARRDLPPFGGERRTIGGYELGERIGEGAFTVVHRATQTSLGREVAVKIIRAEVANRPEFIRRFESEARLVARVEHPNVVPLFDFWREPDRALLVMRWMSGGSLAGRLDGEPWPLGRTISVLEQVAAGLDAAHRVGVTHGDIKPANVLFDVDGHAYLCDFGIALEDASANPHADLAGLAALAGSMLGRAAEAHRSDRIADALASARRRDTASDFAATLRAALADVVAAAEPVTRTPVNPYKGLRAFDEPDAGDFHGRAALVDELLDHLGQAGCRLLAVVGPSGSGKSSVVRAGLLPALRAGRLPGSDQWFITTMVPGSRPLGALEAALLRVAASSPTALAELLRDSDQGIAGAARLVLPGDRARLVVVIDQFEELFGDEVAPDDRDRFLRGVAAAAGDGESPVRFVVTLRADHLDRPLRHRQFASLMKRHTVAVTPLTPDELHAAIVAPAAGVGVSFDAALVSTIVADVTRQAGGLPLLQHALTQMFELDTMATITAGRYAAIGGLDGAVARHAERLWHEMADVERGAARRLFGRLVHLEGATPGAPRRVALRELGYGEPLTRSAVDRYVHARLLTLDRDDTTREPTVEIAHEALVKEWQRLRDWLDDDRDALRAHRHLAAAAQGWNERDRDPNELYRGVRLEAVEGLRQASVIAFNADESEFVAASVARREADATDERRRVRRLHRLVVATAIVAALALVGGLLAYRQRERAEQLATAAETARLVATAESLAGTNPREAMLLAVAADQRERSPATLGALHAALTQASPVSGYLGWGTEYVDVAITADADVIGVRADGVDLFDRGSGEVLDAVDLDVGRGPYPEFSAAHRGAVAGDGLVIATDDTVQVFTVGERFEHRFARPMPAAVAAVAIGDDGDDGELIVATAIDGTVAAWTAGGEDAFAPQRIELHSNLAEQYDAHLDLPLAFEDVGMRDFFANSPVWIVPTVHEGELFLQAGAVTVRLDLQGRRRGDPVYTYLALGNDGALPAATRHVLQPAPGTTLLAGAIAIGELPAPDDATARAEIALAAGTFGPGNRPIVATAPGPDGRPVSLVDDGTLVWFDPATGERTEELDLGVGSARSAAGTEAGDTLAVATERGLALVSLDGSGPLWRSVARRPEHAQLSISHEGRFIVLGGSSVSPVALTVFRVEADAAAYLPLVDFPVAAAVWAGASPGHTGTSMDPLVVWGGYGGDAVTSSLYELAGADEPLLVATFEIDGLTAGDVDPERRWIVTDSLRTQRIHVTAIESGEVVTTLPLAEGGAELTGIRFHPSGERLLVSSSTGRSVLYDTPTWSPVEDDVLAEHDIAVGYWNADGSLLATANSTGEIAVRDGATFAVIRELTGPLATFNLGTGGPLIFSADSALLLTNHDNVARLWDVGTGEQVGVDMTTTDGTNSGVSTGDVLQLVTGHDAAAHSAARIWNLDTESWADVACRTVASNLTAAEWAQWGPRDEPHRPICEGFPLEA